MLFRQKSVKRFLMWVVGKTFYPIHRIQALMHVFGGFSKNYRTQLFNPFMAKLKAPYYHVISIAKTIRALTYFGETVLPWHTRSKQGVFFLPAYFCEFQLSGFAANFVISIQCESHLPEFSIHLSQFHGNGT